jgi:hypothetical protein
MLSGSGEAALPSFVVVLLPRAELTFRAPIRSNVWSISSIAKPVDPNSIGSNGHVADDREFDSLPQNPLKTCARRIVVSAWDRAHSLVACLNGQNRGS